MDNTGDMVVIIIVVGALAIGLISMAVGQVARFWAWLVDWRPRPVMSRSEADQELERGEQPVEPERTCSNGIPQLNAIEPRSAGAFSERELLLNADEIAAIQRMIKHNATAAKPSKSSAIQAGFGVARGGSATYQRASQIYDVLFGTPSPAIKFRQRTPEQEMIRSELGLDKP